MKLVKSFLIRSIRLFSLFVLVFVLGACQGKHSVYIAQEFALCASPETPKLPKLRNMAGVDNWLLDDTNQVILYHRDIIIRQYIQALESTLQCFYDQKPKQETKKEQGK